MEAQSECVRTESRGGGETVVALFVKNLIFTFVVPGTVAVYVPFFLFTNGDARFSVAAVAEVILLLTGGAIYFRCVWDFASFGRGTPAPIDPPKHLVVRGLYRHTRNPMYVGVLAVIFGWALMFHSLPLAVYGLCVAACFHLFVVLYEEPHLTRVFGLSYLQYCSRVSRWLPVRKHHEGT